MSVARIRDLTGIRDFTHTFRTPLAATASIEQLRNSFMRFQNDTSLIVPPAAILNPEYHALLVARLNLPKLRHVDDFLQDCANSMQRRL